MKIVFATLAATVMAASAASAATMVDFTKRTGSNSWTGRGIDGTAVTSNTYGGTTVSLETNPADRVNFLPGFDGTVSLANNCAAAGGELACEGDGLGVRNSEVGNIDTSVTPPLESVTISFSRAVNITELQFLDLYTVGPDSPDPSLDETESAIVYVNGSRLTETEFFASEPYKADGGYKFENVFFKAVTSITLFPGEENDGIGQPDFALAALKFAPVPLPAAAWMLIASMAGIGFMARKRAA